MLKDQDGNFSLKKAFRAAALGLAVMGGGLTAVQVPYVVDNNEQAMIKTTGSLQSGLIEPGMHFKLPWVQDVVKFNLAPQTKEYLKLSTGTKDSQPIYTDLRVVYEIPKESIERLTNQPGWESRIEGVIVSRYKIVLGQMDAANIPEQRNAISVALTEEISKAVMQEVGVKVTDVQFVNYELDPAFLANIQEIANRKAQVEQAKQEQAKASVEADTKKIIADGEKQKAIAEAAGRAEATKLQADAQAYATQKQGEAQANSLKIQLTAVDEKTLTALSLYEAWKSGGAAMPSTLVTGGDTTTLVSPATDAVKAAAGAPKGP